LALRVAGARWSARADRAVSQVKPVMMLARWKGLGTAACRDNDPHQRSSGPTKPGLMGGTESPPHSLSCRDRIGRSPLRVDIDRAAYLMRAVK
jgi:hypothetical protein